MQAIETSSGRVEIIGVIEGIAFQTNILALNAAVEAAPGWRSGTAALLWLPLKYVPWLSVAQWQQRGEFANSLPSLQVKSLGNAAKLTNDTEARYLLMR